MAARLEPRAFAMADIAGSSRLWNRYPDRMSRALARHDALAADAVRAHHGDIFKHTGDGFIATFAHVADALESMAAYQEALATEARVAPIELRSRVGIHYGSAEPRHQDWFGPAINHLARVTELVAPTHVVLSGTAVERVSGDTVVLEHLGDFAVRDAADPVPLYGARLSGAVGPALTVAAGCGLPRFKTRFVGRDADAGALLELLERHQLVTVLGFGGMGKTRLAVEVAHRWSERHGTAAHFVDLVASEDPMIGICDAIGVRSDRGTPVREIADAVAKRSGGGPVLLVVDNCEHVVGHAAAACAALVDAAPGIRVLATSREALELDAEVIFPLGSLTGDASVALLRDRAAAFGYDDVPDAVAVDLCERVAGMPLGIELVAARLRYLDPATLASALDESFDELRTRRRLRSEPAAPVTSADRHATMRSLVAWSYELLSDDERTLLLRLSQLPAPWPRRAAGMLASGLAPNRLDELVAKSLVTPVPAGRLHMLEPVRHYCTEVLAADPPRLSEARALLVDWARDFVPDVPNDKDPVFDAQAARGLVDQIPNLRAALAAAAAIGAHADEADLMLRLWPLSVDGRARGWFGPQLDATLSRTTDPARRRTLIRIALQDTFEKYVDVDREEHLIALLRAVDPDHTSAEWGAVQGNRAVKQLIVDRVLGVDPHPTRQLLVASLELARAKGRRLDQAVALLFMSYSFLLNGEHGEAVDAAESAAESARRANFVAIAALADATGAMAMSCGGEADAALEIIGAAVPLAEHARWESSVRATEVLLLGRTGRAGEARAAVAAVIDLVLAQGVPFLLTDAAIALAAARATAGDLGGGAEALDLAGVGRTPLTIAMLFELAAEIGVDLGIDRFVESFDPEAVARRAGRTAEYLRLARPGLD